VPRFYFHTKMNDELLPDPEGQELPDIDHAINGRDRQIEIVPLAEALPKKLLQSH
jgi:hypothetical protein